MENIIALIALGVLFCIFSLILASVIIIVSILITKKSDKSQSNDYDKKEQGITNQRTKGEEAKVQEMKKPHNSYFHESGNGYFGALTNKGNYGEYCTFNVLTKLNGYSKLLTNVYLPKQYNGMTELDLVLIHETGIYVFESKNYNGWIFGNEKSKEWVQIFPNKKRYKFYNPIMQNESHIRHLRNILGNKYLSNILSVIVFSGKCTLKDVKYNKSRVMLTKREELLVKMTCLVNSRPLILSKAKIDDLYLYLKKYSNVSEEVKTKHINYYNR